MAARSARLLHYLYRLVGRPNADPAGDAALLERFVHQRDESAFSALIARHGPMVLGVCRRVLHDLHAAEDAFQATFLVLARKAEALRRPETLAAWLHGTARRLALKRRQTDERRRQREMRHQEEFLPRKAADPLDEVTAREMLRILDEEMQRLPEFYRLPLILCYLEGRTQEEAARMLGWTPGSVKGRLERGRTQLHTRLVRRGLTLPASLLAGGVLAGGASAARGELWIATSRAALAFASGGGHGTAASVRALAEEALRGSTVGSVKFGLLFLVMTVAGVGAVAYWMPLTPPEAKEAASDQPPAWPRSRDEKVTRTDRLGDPLPPGAIARLGTVRLRPGNQIDHLAFSPDGKRLASGAHNLRLPSRLSIWDTATGRELRGFDVPETDNVSPSWLKDGRCLALPSFGSNGPFVWDLTDEKTPLPSIVHRPEPSGVGFASSNQDDEYDRCYAIAPNGELLAIGCGGLKDDHERPVYLRPLTAGRRIEDLQPLRRLGRQSGNCETLFFTPDSRSLLVFSGRRQAKEDTLVVWDVAAGKKLRQMTVPRANRAVSPDGKTLALGLPDGTARLWDLTTGRETRSLTVTTAKPETYQNGVSAVAFSPDGKHLITGGHDQVVRMWETASGRKVCALRGYHSWVEALAVSPDGKRIASAGQDSPIRIWNTDTGADACPLEGHEYVLWDVAVSPDGTRAVTSGGDGTVRVWDLATGQPVRRIDTGERLTGPFVFTSDGQRLLGRSGSHLRLLDATTGAAVTPPGEMADHPCGRVRFAPDGKTLVTIHDGVARVWEWPTGRLLRQFTLRPDAPKSSKKICSDLAFSLDGRHLIVLSELYDGEGRQFSDGARAAADLWDLSRGQRLRRLRSSRRRLGGAAFTPDGGTVLLAAGSGVPYQEKGSDERLAGALSLLDPRTGHTRRTFAAPAKRESGEERHPVAIACSPDGRTVASAERGGLVLLFETATGLPRRRLVGHRGQVMSLAFTPDGKRLVTGSIDNTGLVWDVSLAALAPRVNADPEQLWDDLASLKAETANRTLATLVTAPDVAIALLKERLHPADGPDTATLDRLLADLDSEQFALRQKAAAELDRLGEDIVFALRKRLDQGESLEARRRIEQLLDKHDRGKLRPERVRELRALEILEQIGTPEARRVLAGLAKGAAEARLTQEAKASLTHMDSLSKSEP